MVKKCIIIASIIICCGTIGLMTASVFNASDAAFPDPIITRSFLDFEMWAPATYTIHTLYQEADDVVIANCVFSKISDAENHLTFKVQTSLKGLMERGETFTAHEKGQRIYDSEDPSLLIAETSSLGEPLIDSNMQVLLFLSKTSANDYLILPFQKFFIQQDKVYAATTFHAIFSQQNNSLSSSISIEGFENSPVPLDEVLEMIEVLS